MNRRTPKLLCLGSSKGFVAGYHGGAITLCREELEMSNSTAELSCEIELQPGEQLRLPPALTERVGAGRWLVSVKPVDEVGAPIRSHAAFLESYDSADEGLYDDCSSR